MKEKYLELMSKALSAYSDEHIHEYFERVKAEGLTEHGFPRLTVNIGVLVCHGYRQDLIPLFIEMMDFCCEQIPKVKAANDFSVREIVFCIFELQKNGMFTDEIERWKKVLSKIVATECYDKFASETDQVIGNWALFTAVSEYARSLLIGVDNKDFVELQIENQLHRLDENGMYMDNLHHDAHQPMVYDLVPRYLFTLLLHFGYKGKHFDRIDKVLRETALMTLKMQSLTGEMAFGGRSNQFVHNEPMLAIIFEYEASRYAREGDHETAGRFKAAIKRAIEVTEYWLSKEPIRHIKNRFPTGTRYGCEKYAYFDKYMITAASHLFSAYLICDDAIHTGNFDDSDTCFMTSSHFHKLFMRSGGYFLEFDTNADPHYDSSGLGRVHRYGAPAPICLSLPCTDTPKYKLCTEDKLRASLCPGVVKDGKEFLSCDSNEAIEVVSYSSDKARLKYPLGITANYVIADGCVTVTVVGDGEILHMLPAFSFDGEIETVITLSNNMLEIAYEGWICRYSANGDIRDLGKTARNRNGYYKLFCAEGNGKLDLKIEIIKI
ncbi:MAG: hypothetical protein J6S71_04440 [Clostridia bacterium]|nr:hypothetical protein [Clostridia bacterium]